MLRWPFGVLLRYDFGSRWRVNETIEIKKIKISKNFAIKEEAYKRGGSADPREK